MMTDTEFNFEHLADDIRAAQAARQIPTQKELASAIGISEPQLSNLLKNGRALGLKNVIRVCAWLDRPIEAYRVFDEPPWVAERRAASALAPERAAELASRRQAAAQRFAETDGNSDGLTLSQFFEQVRAEVEQVAMQRFASTVRFRVSSDQTSSLDTVGNIDVVVRFTKPVSLLEQAGLQGELSEILGRDVGLLDEDGLRHREEVIDQLLSA